jgi:hypothetical protein
MSAHARIVRLTFQEYTPNTGVRTSPLSYGIYNMGPCPVSGGKVVFTSNRNGFIPPKGFTPVTSQLYVMDDDGSNVRAIAPMTLGAALHPFQLADGRVAFSSYESQGLRDPRIWGLWAIWPDGRAWEPLMSAFSPHSAFHFSAQLSGGDLVVEDYYNLNNNGFGTFYRFPTTRPASGIEFYQRRSSRILLSSTVTGRTRSGASLSVFARRHLQHHAVHAPLRRSRAGRRRWLVRRQGHPTFGRAER